MAMPKPGYHNRETFFQWQRGLEDKENNLKICIYQIFFVPLHRF